VTFATTLGTAYDIDIGAFSQSAGNLTLSVTAAEEPPPPPAPVELTLAVDPTATLNPKTGVATITGTATCTLPAQGGLFVDLFQEGGRFDAEGFADASLSCDTEPTAFSITVTSDATKFLGGIAQLHVEAFVETEEGASDFRLVDTDVRLRPAGSKH
jgi:hypothetical protein